VADVDELSRRLAAAQEQQRAVGRVLRAVARAEGLQHVLDEVVRAATVLSGLDNARLFLVEDGLLRAFANYGMEETFEFDRQHPHPIDRATLTGRAALTRAPVHIPDVLDDPEYTYPGPRPYRAGLSVPVIVEEELIGVLGAVRLAPGPFADEQIELVQTFADQAAVAIANARLIDTVERQRMELSRFLSPQVAELVSSPDGERLLAGHRGYISVMFCDLRGFTSYAETAEPEELLEVLRAYHEALGELIPRYGGTLEHFAGDGVMVFFNDPLPVEDHELQAVRMAVASQERFAELAEGWRKRGTELGLGIGIASGYATLGRIGFEGRYDYAALGRVTNLAARLSTNAAAGQTLISQRVHAAVEGSVTAEPVGELDLKGFAQPVRAFEVTPESGNG
jgi:class 3 adenylate cyclase